VPPVSVAAGGGAATLDAKINGLSAPANSYTNLDAGIWQVVRDNSVYNYQAVIVLTDGNPTRYGPPAKPGGVTFPVTTRFAEVENGIFSANTLKDEGTPVLAMGIGAGGRAPLASTDNLRAISGQQENTDYFNTDYNRLTAVLKQLSQRNCAGIGLVKSASPKRYSHVGQKITYTYTVTNTGNVTLHGIRVTDNKIHGPVACAATVLRPGAYTLCHATYVTTKADVTAGRVVNLALVVGRAPKGARVTAKAWALITATLPEVPVTG
jgi:hypothetical protein